MRDDAVIAAIILLGMLSSRSRKIEWGGGWWWPVPDLRRPDGSVDRAVVSQEFRGGGADPHYGVDVMYRNRNPPPTFTAPVGTPIIAAREGSLWSVARTERGWAVVIDHGPPFATFYQHLADVSPDILAGLQGKNVITGSGKRALPIAAGRTIGTMGEDPTDAGHVRHLHFAVWYGGAGDRASVDPADVMHAWRRSIWTEPQSNS